MQTTSTSDQGSERVNAKNTKKENGIEPLTGDTRTPKQSAVKWWTALDSNGNLIQIESTRRGEKYRCYECECRMTAKMGQIKAHHFAHVPDAENHSKYCGGEGYRHLRVKTVLCKLLQNINSNLFRTEVKIDMEKMVDEFKPDILVRVFSKEMLAIEVVDTNPHRIRREKWGKNLYELEIKTWKDSEIQDYAILTLNY